MRTTIMAALAAGMVLATPVAAQDYPSQPVHLIVPYAPGGVLDTTARAVGAKLQVELGQPVVIDNRPGGNAAIGTGVAAGAQPDGYTLLIATSAEIAVSPALTTTLPYNMDTDFEPITLVNDTPIVVIASADSGFKTIDDLIAAGREREVAYGTPSVGSSHHLLGEAMAHEAGANFLHIAYQGASPAATAVAAGEVAFGVASISAAMPHIQSGRAVPLAVASPERVAVLPDVPTLVESGLDITTSVWIGLFAPAGTPGAIIDKVSASMKVVLEDPELIERFAASGAVATWSEPEALTERRKAETESSRAIVERAGIKAE